MSQTAIISETQPTAGLSDSFRGSAIAGWLIIAAFFGGLGFWAVTAPLNGAVVATGIVKVDGNRKSVQHLDGGIVKQLRIKEGDKVQVGDVLIVLDDTQTRAEFDVLSEQFVVLRATEERLRAEFVRSELNLPEDLRAARDDQHVEGIWDNQVRQFESRRTALEGQRAIIREKIAQLQQQIVGGEAQVKAFKAQLASVHDEIKSIMPLVEQGLIARPRYLQLERAAAGLDGQSADAMANIARTKQAIAEQQQQMAQLDNDRMADVTKDLRDVQAKLLEVIPRLMNARAVLTRMEIRSPYGGRVVGLNVFSVGGVIQRGDKILDVVPEKDMLVVETQVAVDDISEVRPEMRAEVHLTAYKQRITPIVHGTVLHISADRLTESRTGTPYYTALLRLDEAELAEMPNIQLYPGMPATVMIPTTERTAFEYLMGPLMMSLKHGFRQK
ncbi:HlyD family type I secretion periplasmic adaptor subunit [Caballeronia mineralivorans]|uniref:HlyD family type I secretion periplasmic adaptor subunit n=1 Tax=Caballeronia mineralivorans TaxID=2010198 RepID=UPI0023F00254|nr:HlyD family type I secretion periplasmic adaptor subunit [Caballeronia mineralivorans]MDB5565811.1 HlyD family type secretion periplasmic adaptor subunit [Tardiphaga sp.]MDB5785145.1 HlyD family type secretion periplasmic adaptor subunit [Caballeronia mineralivorans]